jgi:uncharacterized membrane protein YfcA
MTVPILFNWLSFDLFDALFLSIMMDTVSSLVLVLLYLRHGKVDVSFVLHFGGIAALAGAFSSRLSDAFLESHTHVLRGSVGYVPIVFGFIFLGRAARERSRVRALAADALAAVALGQAECGGAANASTSGSECGSFSDADDGSGAHVMGCLPAARTHASPARTASHALRLSGLLPSGAHARFFGSRAEPPPTCERAGAEALLARSAHPSSEHGSYRLHPLRPPAVGSSAEEHALESLPKQSRRCGPWLDAPQLEARASSSSSAAGSTMLLVSPAPAYTAHADVQVPWLLHSEIIYGGRLAAAAGGLAHAGSAAKQDGRAGVAPARRARAVALTVVLLLVLGAVCGLVGSGGGVMYVSVILLVWGVDDLPLATGTGVALMCFQCAALLANFVDKPQVLRAEMLNCLAVVLPCCATGAALASQALLYMSRVSVNLTVSAVSFALGATITLTSLS